MNNGWYYLAAKNDILLLKEADVNWKDVKKGLGWGSGLGAIPLSFGLMGNPEQAQRDLYPTQKTKEVSPYQEFQKLEPPINIPSQKSSIASDSELEKFIVPFEGGYKNKAYKDSKRIWTIGAGFNLTRKDADSLLSQIGATKQGLISGKEELSQEQMSKLFQTNLKTAKEDAVKWIPNLNEQPKEVQLIAIDMAFNMGGPVLSQFKQTAKYLINKDYLKAASEMKKSKWYGQVGQRSKHHVDVISHLSQEVKK